MYKIIYLLLLIISLSTCIQIKHVESELIEDSRGYVRHTKPLNKYVEYKDYKTKR